MTTRTPRTRQRWPWIFGCACGALILATACESADWGKWIDRAKKAAEVGREINKAMEPTQLSPEQEHYVGRAVSAKILGAYQPLDNPKANRYVNLLGQTLARFSDRPETFKGYHFLILDTDEVNAFATPGGFVFVTRGLVRCCPSEDALAAVLAHEIGHVVYKHSLRSIRAKRLSAVGGLLLGEAAGNLGDGEVKQLTECFGGSVEDVSQTLMFDKFSRKTEVMTDEMMVAILKRAGYDPKAFLAALTVMKERLPKLRGGFGTTHPDPDYRMRVVEQAIGDHTPAKATEARAARFAEAFQGI